MFVITHYFKSRRNTPGGQIPKLLFIVFSFFSLLEGRSQSFTEIAEGQVKGQELGYSSWCDVNGDGFLDIFITGLNLSSQGDFKNALIYLNDQMGSFHESGINTIPRVIYGSHDWGDFNNDGLPDLVLSGTISGFPEDAITKIFIKKEEQYQPLTIELPGLMNSQVKWFDYNMDGWQDLFLMGINQDNEFIMKVYANQEGESMVDSQMIFPVPPGQRTNLGRTGVLIHDFDMDGDKDILVGQNSSKGFSIDAYEYKEGNYLKKEIVLPQLSNASFAKADFNRDGFLDVVVNGIQEKETINTYDTPCHFVVLKGHPGFTFSVLREFKNGGSYWGSVCAGDLDGDGLPDIIINGSGNRRAKTSFFINKNGFDFVLHEIPGVIGTLLGDAHLGDLDNDGRLDLLVTGSIDGSASTAQARIYKNTTHQQNKRPSVPQNLGSEYKNGKINFSWDSSNDSNTSQKSISYNIRIGREPRGMDVLSSMSMDKGSRIVEGHGNVGFGTSFTLNVPEGTYYWQVQSIDAAYYESDFSEIHIINTEKPREEPPAEPGSEIFIPNVITPNQDKKNDFFFIQAPSDSALSVAIYNRNGTLVFFSPSYRNDFDGENLSAGIYFYHVKDSLSHKTWRGSLTIIR